MIGSYLKRFINIEALIPFAIVMVFILLALGLLARKTPGYKRRRKKYFYYLAALIAVMGIFLAIIYNLKQSALMFRYFWMLAFATIMGGLHVFFYRYLFEKFDSDKGLKELLFGIITSFAVMVPVIMMAAHYKDLQYLPYYFLTIAAFTSPTSLFVLYKYSVSIPVKLYTKWYYPLQKKYDIPEHYELKNMIDT
ncbi:TssN family type VI secretion system protein [Zobellia nedashkovskayae]